MAAEALGLAFGALSLASLFQICVQCYEYIDRGKACRRDFAILMTRLEVEKIRLVMWGESVDVFHASEGMHGVFEHPQVRNAIYNVLECIRMVFTNVHELQSRYGLILRGKNDERSAALEDPRHIRPVEFHLASNKLQNVLKRSQKRLGIVSRGIWAVRDWKKFTLMLDDLLSFNNGLEAITNSSEAQRRRPQLIQATLESLQPNLLNLRLVEEATAGKSDRWAETASSIIDQSQGDTAEAHVLGWRENIELGTTTGSKASINLDNSSAILEPATERNTSLDVFTLRGSLTDIYFITTRSLPSSNDPWCCLERDEKWGNLWEVDDEDEIAELIDANVDDWLFYDISADQEHKRKTYCYVYCPPCMASMWLAARICRDECWKGKSTNMTWRIRPDERLDPGNCEAHSPLERILSTAKICRRQPGDYGWWVYLDQNYIRRRLYASGKNDGEIQCENSNGISHDLNVGTILKEQRRAHNCAATVFIASTEAHHAFSSLPGFVSFSKVPEAHQVYQYKWDPNALREPVFLGTYQSVSSTRT